MEMVEIAGGYVKLMFQTNTTTTNIRCAIYMLSDSYTSGDPATAYTSTNRYIDVFGFNLVNNSMSTSFIYEGTEGSVVTRYKDIVNSTSMSSNIDTLNGWFMLDLKALANDLSYRTFMISDGTTVNKIGFYYSVASNSIVFFYRASSVNVYSQSLTLTDITTYNKILFAYSNQNFRVFYENAKQNEQLSGSVSSFIASDLEFNDNINIEYMEAYIKEFKLGNYIITDEEALSKIS